MPILFVVKRGQPPPPPPPPFPLLTTLFRDKKIIFKVKNLFMGLSRIS